MQTISKESTQEKKMYTPHSCLKDIEKEKELGQQMK